MSKCYRCEAVSILLAHMRNSGGDSYVPSELFKSIVETAWEATNAPSCLCETGPQHTCKPGALDRLLNEEE